MATVKELKATARPAGGKGAARAERRAGRVPGVVYGNNQPPVTISVDDAELRIDRRPAVWSGLTAIVEAGPGKSARQPFASSVKLPPFFGQFGPGRMLGVISAYPVA